MSPRTPESPVRLWKMDKLQRPDGPQSDQKVLRTRQFRTGNAATRDENLQLSAHAYDRILKVPAQSRTSHIGEAIQYRTLDRKLLV